MRYILPDGYIEFNENGNIYCGNVAHNIMHKAEQIQRDSKKQMRIMFGHDVDVDLNTCLLYMLKASYEVDFGKRSEFLNGLHGNGLPK